ncbi:MAG TPA: hypothetical protein VMT52_15870, partial [Planctomycetota bacterium]|nr:hypothetical protein [Planctomycetota bacterium]
MPSRPPSRPWGGTRWGVVHDKDLAVLTAFPGPFDAEDDELSAIAFHSGKGTFFVYNAATNMVAEITGEGATAPPRACSETPDARQKSAHSPPHSPVPGSPVP